LLLYSLFVVFHCISKYSTVSALDGINGTIFAYGQTSSGKTFTMKGSSTNPGIIPRALEDVFSIIANTPDREFLLRLSYLEIYNEVVRDLLAPNKTNLKIHEDLQRGVFVGELTEEIVISVEHAMRLLQIGESK
jgi:centromeric protein E